MGCRLSLKIFTLVHSKFFSPIGTFAIASKLKKKNVSVAVTFLAENTASTTGRYSRSCSLKAPRHRWASPHLYSLSFPSFGGPEDTRRHVGAVNLHLIAAGAGHATTEGRIPTAGMGRPGVQNDIRSYKTTLKRRYTFRNWDFPTYYRHFSFNVITVEQAIHVSRLHRHKLLHLAELSTRSQ